MSSDLEQDIAGWLATRGLAAEDTVREPPGETIVPARSPRETRSERALELLRRLAGASDQDGPRELEIREEIARGGLGCIQAAEQVALGREVVVKTLRRELRDDFGATMDLLREAWVTGALEHPNVVPVYDIALDADGYPLIVLKRIEGVTWSRLMRDAAGVAERFGAEDLFAWNFEILLQVINAVRYAHSRGIIHRDLKPDNVMIGEFGEVYVVDWGIALSLDDDPTGRLPSATRAAGLLAGTPCYLPPESLGDEPLDQRADIYQLGAIAYEIMVGTPPHDGASVLEVLTKVAQTEPTYPEEAPAELVTICRRAMARRPEDRYASGDELRLALQRFLRHRGSTKLGERAQIRLVELLDHLQHWGGRPERTPSAEEKRQIVYNLLGECRFGFGAALSAWPENPEARAGLAEALCQVAWFELGEGDPGAAQSLIAGLDDPPEALRAAIDSGIAARKEERRRFEAYRREADPLTGNRTRIFLTWVLGSLWTTIPLIIHWLDRATGIATQGDAYLRMGAVTLGMLLIVVGLAGWAREAVSRSRLNRTLLAILVAVLAAQLAMIAGAHVLALDPVIAQSMIPISWFFGAASFSLLDGWRTAPLTTAYLGAFFASVWHPEYRFLFMSGANLICTLNGYVVWRSLRAQAGEQPSS